MKTTDKIMDKLFMYLTEKGGIPKAIYLGTGDLVHLMSEKNFHLFDTENNKFNGIPIFQVHKTNHIGFDNDVLK